MTGDHLLLDGRWLPVTRSVGFVEADVDTVVAAFLGWRGRFLQESTGHAMQVRAVHGDLEGILASTLPLVVAMPSRYLFLPTVSGWTACVENLWAHNEPAWTTTQLARRERLGVRGVEVTAAPHTNDQATDLGSYGIRRLGYAEPFDGGDRAGMRGTSVGVQVLDAGGRWVESEPDDWAPFPDLRDRTARRVALRFTHEHLVATAAWFGLRPFDEDFYVPDGTAVLVEDTQPRDPAWSELTLDQALANGHGVL